MKLLRHGEPRPALRPAVFVTLDQINPASTGSNVLVCVLSVAEDSARREGGHVLEAEVADRTAKATLLLNRKRFPHVRAGDVVALRNLRIKVARGYCLLDIDPWGRITPETGDPGEPNHALDVSKVLYELKD